MSFMMQGFWQLPCGQAVGYCFKRSAKSSRHGTHVQWGSQDLPS